MMHIEPLILDPIKQLKFVEKPKYFYKTSYINIPCIKYIEKKYVDLHENYIYKNFYVKKTIYVEKIKHIPKIVTKEKTIEIPKIIYKNKYVDKPIYVIKNKIIHKPVNMVIEKVIPVLEGKTRNEQKYLDEIEIKNLFLKIKDAKYITNNKNYNNVVIIACNILEALIKKICGKHYKEFFIYLKSCFKCYKNVLDSNNNHHNINGTLFLKGKNNESFLNIKREIEKYEEHDIFFNMEINKFINCISEENKSNLYNSFKGKIKNEKTPYIKNMNELRKKINLNNYSIDHNIDKENESKFPLISKNDKKKSSECPIFIPYKDFVDKKNKEIHLLEGKLHKNCNEIKTSELNKNFKIKNKKNFKHFYEKNYPDYNFESFNNDKNNNLILSKIKENVYNNKRILRNDVIMLNSCGKNRKQNNSNILEMNYKKKNIKEILYKKNSSESDIIIDDFIKNIRNNKLLHITKTKKNSIEKRKSRNEIFNINSSLNSNYYKRFDVKKFENDKIETFGNEKFIRNCNKSSKLLDYGKNTKENENILILLYKIINEFKINNDYEKNNKKTDEKKIIYICKTQNIINKYKKLFENYNNDIKNLHYYFKKNEIFLLKDILVYIIEIMNRIKYEYRGMEKQIEEQIYEIEETIRNRQI
ncbi:conserved Plasmodium protein, unknown function [Plasmodium gallinaceum]|uniref:Uncharacterized protein n=1 Tax=Plasmodium gallinaceum TaxID=5849 RepID=A0A1J1H193_PLAGA|nr:conserved Plasmodium protein, unknown function [Plasmodium gallinaceum]CRG97061.1 conserved Plasmodium protein, unknown function [Plasmodium gallinaceum]